jgi:ABC-type nitrate/sulfonate/bicarbonate transport system permease component
MSQLGATLARTLAGAALGIVAGIVCGLLMGLSLPVQKSTESLLSILISTPKVSLLPILMLVLGIGEAPRLTLIATTAFVVVALQMLDAVLTLDGGYRELAANYGADSWQLIRWVYLPAALPHLFTGIRLGIGRALGTCITVEILGARHGIGHMIWSGWESFQPDRIYVGVFLTATLGVAFHLSLKAIERRIAPWRV